MRRRAAARLTAHPIPSPITETVAPATSITGSGIQMPTEYSLNIMFAALKVAYHASMYMTPKAAAEND